MNSAPGASGLDAAVADACGDHAAVRRRLQRLLEICPLHVVHDVAERGRVAWDAYCDEVLPWAPDQPLPFDALGYEPTVSPLLAMSGDGDYSIDVEVQPQPIGIAPLVDTTEV